MANQDPVSPQVQKFLANFDTSLNLDPAERADAELTHNSIRDVLVDDEVICQSFLQGSFAKKTMLKPLADIDVVGVLPMTLAEVQQQPNATHDAMKAIRASITRAFPDATFDDDGKAAHALQVGFPGKDFTVDLVPAVPDPNDGEVVHIANRNDDSWKRSSVKRLNRLVRERNQATNGRFIHQVRMLKAIARQQHELSEVAGIFFESAAYAVIENELDDAHAIAAALRHCVAAAQYGIFDPAGDEELTRKWLPEERSKYVAVLKGLADLAEEAVGLDAVGEPELACEVWAKLTGQPSPDVPARSEAALFAAAQSGSMTSTGRVSSSTAGQQPMRPTRSWRCS